MRELPKVFANKISDNINNTQDFFYGNNRNINSNKKESVMKKINNIFASSNHVYKSNVKITTKKGIMNTILVGKTNRELINMKGELIKIEDIIDIEKI